MLTTGWLLVAGGALTVGLVVCVALIRSVARRRHSEVLEVADRQRWLMARIALRQTDKDEQPSMNLPRCDACGEVFGDMAALRDHAEHRHRRAA